MCFLLTDHRQEEVCWRLSSTNWAANPFLEIPHEWTCAKLRSTPPRQDKSSLKHIILFGWRLPSPTSVTSDCRIPTSDEYLRPILIDPEISIHLSYFCGKKRGNILMIGYCCCRKSPPALPVCLAKGCLVAVALFVLNVYFCSVLRLRIISMTDFESTSCYCRCCCCWCWCWCCCWFCWCFWSSCWCLFGGAVHARIVIVLYICCWRSGAPRWFLVLVAAAPPTPPQESPNKPDTLPIESVQGAV